MPKIKRIKPPLHILVVDTNALWYNDKSFVVAPEFQAFWNTFAEEFELKLMIPEVVRGELLYQQSSSALTSLERANKQFETLSNIADASYKHRITTQRVYRDIEKRFERWLANTRVDIQPTPLKSIDWQRLINDAIWRKPPFIGEKDREKGFRDALILETVCSLSTKEQNTDIAFISRDRLLRETASSRLDNLDNFSVYESVDEFSSYLKLTKEKLTSEFVRAIQKRARNKFYNAKHHTGLAVTQKIVDSIRNEFAEKFVHPSDSMTLVTLYATGKTKDWESCSKEAIWVEGARFDYLEGDDEFNWISPISFVELFKRSSEARGLLALTPAVEEKLRILEFNVHWKANVKADGRFHKLKIVKIEFDKQSFEIATSQQLENYRIQRNNEA